MRDSSSSWDTENAKIAKHPRFLFDLGLTDSYASGDFTSRNTSTQKLFAGIPRIQNTEITPLKPSLNLLGEIAISVQDNNNAITTLISANTILGRAVTIKYGFKDIAESNFMNLYKGRIIDYSFGSDLLNYNFRILSSFKDFNKQAFTGISETAIRAKYGKAEFSFFLAANVSAGTPVSITFLLKMPPDVDVGDTLFISDGAANETFVVKELDAANNTIIATTLANSYTTANSAFVVNNRIPVDSVTGFLAATVPFDPPFQDGVFVMVGNEIMKTDNTTSGGSPLIHVASGRNPIIIDTVRGAHGVDTIVKECYVLRDDPITLLLGVLTTTTAGNNQADATIDFDLGTGTFGDLYGVGMSHTLIDFQSFLLVRDTYFPNANDELRYFITEPMTALEFALDIARSAGFYFVITQNGLLGIRKVVYPSPGMSVDTITDGDFVINSSGNISGLRWASGQDQMINEIEYRYDWSPSNNKFNTVRTFSVSAAQTTYNQVRRHVIESKGLRRAITNIDSAFVTPLNSAILRRYLNPPPRLEFDLKMENSKLEAGDFIKVTSTKIPDIAAGDRTLSNELMELVKVEPDFEQGVIHCAGYFYGQENGQAVGDGTTIESMTRAIATFDGLDSDLIDTVDAHFDNSVDAGGITGTRYIVVVSVALDQDAGSASSNSIKYHIRIDTETGGTIDNSPYAGELDFTHSWISNKLGGLGHVWYNTHVFEVSSGEYDVTIDFATRSGTDAGSIGSVTMQSVTIETDGSTFTEL